MSPLTLVLITVAVMAVFIPIIVWACLKITGPRVRKYDGYLDVSTENGKLIHQLDIRTDPSNLSNQAHMVLKIRKVEPKPKVEEFADNT